MSRKRKPLPLLENITITGVAAEGNAVARREGQPVLFIPYGAPGDVVDVQLTRHKRSYEEGRIARMVHPSPIRVEPQCPYFGMCGGCRWQHLPYDYQLTLKRQQVDDCLLRIGHLEYPTPAPCLPSPQVYAYRNKMEYTYTSRRWLTPDELASGHDIDNRGGAGFHIPGAFDKVLDINTCELAPDTSNVLRNFVRDYIRQRGYTFYDMRTHSGLMRNMMVRTAVGGQVMAVLMFGEERPGEMHDVMDAIVAEMPDITSLMYTVNTKVNDSWTDLRLHLHHGRPYLEEQMEELTFRVGPQSFYQTNRLQALNLYTVARRMAALTGTETVYDLYTGTGTIALFVARQCARVIGIEYVESAIDDARRNAALNGIDNAEFHAGDMKDVLSDAFIAEHGTPDVMIVDPPRAGIHADVVATILRARPRRIVYVSCNPATQARDLALLAEAYTITEVQPVDMFPHTAHVENVVALTLRDGPA